MFSVLVFSLGIFIASFYILYRIIVFLSKPDTSPAVLTQRLIVSYLFLMPAIGFINFVFIFHHAKLSAAMYTKTEVNITKYDYNEINGSKYYEISYLHNNKEKHIKLKNPIVNYISLPQQEKASFMLCTKPAEKLFVKDKNGTIQLKGLSKKCAIPTYNGIIYLQQKNKAKKD